MKLEIKHLAPYLPYGLKLQYVVRDKVEKTGIINSISHNEDETHPTRISISSMYDEEHIWMFKPILRPLSDLTKEIEVDGKKFVPIYIIDKRNNLSVLETTKDADLIDCLSYWVINYLLEWHFDVFGLIENDLAVDINDLEVER